jgi:hypothetical protein
MRAIPFPALTAAAVVALGALPLRAAEAPPIRVSLPSCSSAPFSIESFLGLLEVELAGHPPPCCVLAAPGAATDAGTPGLQVALSLESCDAGATAVDVRVYDGGGARSVERRVGLRDIPPEARARALALAAAELVHALAQAPPARAVAAPPAPTAPKAPTAAVAPRGPPALAASGIVQLESHPGNNMLLWGLAASVAAGRGIWQAALDLQYLTGDPSIELGDVHTTVLAAALTAGPRVALGRVVLELGATGRLGGCWMSGHITAPNAFPGSGSALIGSAGARLGMLLPTAAGVSHLRAVVEGGAMIHGLEAEVNEVAKAGVAGGYLLFSLGFGEHR